MLQKSNNSTLMEKHSSQHNEFFRGNGKWKKIHTKFFFLNYLGDEEEKTMSFVVPAGKGTNNYNVLIKLSCNEWHSSLLKNEKNI